MCETDLVIRLMEELSRRDCNGHATVRLGEARADPDTFSSIFAHYARGTYFENVDLDVEVVEPVVACSCGYRTTPTNTRMLQQCPRCSRTPQLMQGNEFAIIEPKA